MLLWISTLQMIVIMGSQPWYTVFTQQTFVLVKTCWRHVQYVFKTYSAKKFFIFQNVFKTPWWHFANISLIRLANTSGKCIEDVLKSSWKINNCYSEDVFKRSLGQHFSTCHFRKYQYSKKAFSSFFKRERNFSVSRKFPRYFWT